MVLKWSKKKQHAEHALRECAKARADDQHLALEHYRRKQAHHRRHVEVVAQACNARRVVVVDRVLPQERWESTREALRANGERLARFERRTTPCAARPRKLGKMR